MKKDIISLTTLIIWLAGAVSCSSPGNFGTLREHHQVTGTYRNFEVVPDYQYFYYGRFLEPDAIMGIDQSFEVKSQLWKPVALDRDQLETWIEILERSTPEQHDPSGTPRRYQGAYILDPGGQVVGTWYTRFDWGVFKFSGPKVIEPYPPSFKPASTRRVFLLDD